MASYLRQEEEKELHLFEGSVLPWTGPCNQRGGLSMRVCPHILLQVGVFCNKVLICHRGRLSAVLSAAVFSWMAFFPTGGPNGAPSVTTNRLLCHGDSSGTDGSDTELITQEWTSGRAAATVIIRFGVWRLGTRVCVCAHMQNMQRLCIARGERNVLRFGFVCWISLLLLLNMKLREFA